jgi:hypothetical protein
MTKSVLLTIWQMVSSAWIGFATYLCLQGWPHVPMDMSPGDPATKAALGAAVNAHILRHVVIGAIPPLGVLLLGRLLLGRR